MGDPSGGVFLRAVRGEGEDGEEAEGGEHGRGGLEGIADSTQKTGLEYRWKRKTSEP